MQMKRTRRVYIILAGCALIGLSGCNLLQRDAKEGAVVQVGNNYLYAEDLAAVVHPPLGNGYIAIPGGQEP